MAKFKAAGSRKTGSGKTGSSRGKNARSNLAAVPCLLLILTGAAIISFLFYELLKQSS
jgi:hypothetical protein